MSQSEHGNPKNKRSGPKRSRGRRDDRRGADSARRGGRADHRGQQRQGRGGRGRGEGGGGDNRPTAPSLEYVLIQEGTSLAAEITSHPGPMRWRTIPDVALLSPGLYLRYRGSLQLVTRKLAVPNAVLYAVWNDENLSYRFRDGWASPGLRAAFLVPTPFGDDEGPPWIPIDAAIPDTIEAWDTGLLSSQLDPVHCASFSAKMSADTQDLWVSAESIKEDGHVEADAALQQTMEWLARNPDSDHPGAVTARVMLVEQGHGLQRAGVAAMRTSQERTAALLADVLSVLAPDVAPVLQAVQRLWLAEDDEQTEHFVALARVLEPHVANDDSPLQQPRNLAVLTTWLTGIFGSRPDRERRRPARSLFAAFRLLRRTRGNLEAFEHPDIDLPTFPTSRALSDDITRELSFFPQRETDLERLIRAMAVGESTRDFGRIHLDHIRPFALSYRRVRGYPIAARTLLGRYDGIVTMWSFRGKELERGGIPARALNANFVFETSTWASIRAYGRVLGAKTAISSVLAEALNARPERGAPHHPDVVRLHELDALELSEVAERLGRATRARRPNMQRVSDAIAAHEFLVARMVRDNDALPDWAPIQPEWGDGDDTAVRRHFMYWRTYCRSYLPLATESYGTFIARVVPELSSLPWKIENEALALMRTWSRQVDAEEVSAYEDILHARLNEILEEGDHAARDERALNILSVLAGCSFESWERGVERLLEHAQWENAEWNRILDGVREGTVREALRESELFKRLAAAFADGPSVGVSAGRVEWLRQLLGRGRRSHNIRWLLQRDAWPEVVYAPRFEQWFKEHAVGAIDAPEEAVNALLLVAATEMSAETIDIPMCHLTQNNGEKLSAHVDHLIENSQGLAASAWLSNRTDLDEAQVNAALAAGITEARSIADLRILARAVFAAEAQGLTIDAAQRDQLAARVTAHEVPPHNYPALDNQLDAWRLLDLPLNSEEAGIQARRVALALAGAKGPSPARAFAYWAADRALVREVGDDLLAAIGDASTLPLFEGAMDDFEWPEAIVRMLRVAARSKRQSRQFRSVWGALRNADQSNVLEAWLDAWILRRASSDRDATLDELEAFVPALQELIAQLADDASDKDATDADKDDAQQNDQEGSGRSEEQDEDADRADEQEDGEQTEEAKTAVERLGDSLKEHVRRRALERMQQSVQFWIEQLRNADQSAFEALPKAVNSALSNPLRLRVALRDSVFPRVLQQASARDLQALDPRNVVANPMIPFDVTLSPTALDLSIVAALEVFAAEDHVEQVKLTRDALQVAWTAPVSEDDASDVSAVEEAPAPRVESSKDEVTEAQAGDVDEAEQPAVEDEPAGDDAAETTMSETGVEQDDADEDTDSETANADDASTQEAPPKAKKPEKELSARVQAWNLERDDSPEEQTPASLYVACVQRALERDGTVNLIVRQSPNGEEAVVRWRKPRGRFRRGKR